jgi:WD40 repeat protein
MSDSDDKQDDDQNDPGELPTAVDPQKTELVLEHAFDRPLTACHWASNGRYILVGSEHFGIHRFDLQNKAVTHLVGPHDSWVRAIGTSPDGSVAYSGGYDGRLVWWPIEGEKPEPIRSVDAHDGWIRALAVRPDGARIATCGNDHMVKVWDSGSGEAVAELAGHQWHVYNVAFSPAGDRLVSCDLRGHLRLWDTSGESEVQLIAELPQLEALYKYDTTFRADIGGARCMAFSLDGKRVAIGGVTKVTNAFAGVGDATVLIVDLESQKVAQQYSPKESVRGTAWGIVEHPAGFWVGMTGGGGGGWFYFWRGDESAEFFKLKLKAEGRGMSVSPSGQFFAVAHADRNLRIYSPTSAELPTDLAQL